VPEEIEGTALGHRDGHGFMQRDDGGADLYLPPNEMRAVLHRDRIKARIVRHDRKGRPEGKVTEIIERPPHPIIGRLLQESGVWLVAPEDKRYGQDVLVPKTGTGNAKVGQVVVVQLTEPPSLYGQPVGRVKEVLGEVDDPGMEIEIAVRKYAVPHEFSEACLNEARLLPDHVRPSDKKGRVDLTDVALVTIDGEDARDFDDAVYCEPTQIGKGKAAQNGWRLLVAIADVSHYVKNGAAIDIDAYERATSVYFPRRVIPMLPEKLSNGLCSLKPDVERMCMVCDMLVSAKGEVTAYQFYPAVMHSHARFTYTEVAAILSNTRGPEAAKRKERVQDLLNLHDVYRALLVQRNVRGAVDFETTETQIVCDDNGRIEKIIPRTRNDAHKLIEEAMLAANVCSADFILRSKHLGLYRVHEGPTPEKKETLRQYLKTLGLNMTISEEPVPAEFQAIATATKDRPDAQQIHTMLLRSMSQAIYTPVNSGHFGLAFEAYTHFTSPIRRYPDLLVHRVIKAVLEKTKYTLPALPMPGEAQDKLKKRLAARAANNAKFSKSPAAKPKKSSVEQVGWEAAGIHCSANERRADEASKDVEAWLKCKYMREHLGEEYAGTVSSATSFGLFVTLDAMYVEGLVHITELGGEYFKFDEIRCELRGERTGMRYAIGTRVNVQVSRVDLDGRKIDFRLVRDGEAVRLPSGGIARLDADESATGRPARKRDKGDRGDKGMERSPVRASRGDRMRGDSGARSDFEAGFDSGYDRKSGVPASRKAASKTAGKSAPKPPSKAVARAPASPLQALRAAVKKAAAKGKGKRRGR
jgi:ribonuclease R